ncbi:MAG: cytochrome P450 [Firmicutes bacterium]|nr:cytochrome P450 [Bacillota bacterium]
MHELFEFAEKTLARRGALVDFEDGKLKAVIPKDVASALEISEYTTFTDDEPGQNEIMLTYSSDIMEKLVEITRSSGKISRFFLSDIEAKKEVTLHDIKRCFEFINSKVVSVETEKIIAPYFVFNFKYSMVSDERKDGIASVTVNGHTLAGIGTFDEGLLHFRQDETSDSSLPLPDPKPIGEIYNKACFEVKQIVQNETEHFKTILSRRLERDIKRLEEYYHNLINELGKRKRGRKSSIEEIREDLQKKEDAVRTEFELKRNDILKKYDTKINFSLFSAARLSIPSILTKIKAQYKKETIIIPTVWNPLAKDLEPVSCRHCKADTKSIFICQNKHIVCEKCHGTCPECGKKYCLACNPQLPCGHKASADAMEQL